MMRQALGNSATAGAVTFDQKAAFPSIHHWWLFAVLTRWNLPSFFVNCIKALYRQAWCSMRIHGYERGGLWAFRG
eukprot:5105098-Pyramimonas_sp.AAC.1